MQKVTSKDGTAIAYERFGDGAPLILVGGAFNDRRSPSAGAPLAELLAPDFTVYAYDRRGRGDSGDTPPYATEREVEDIQALIAEAGGAAALFGHSSGAALALHAAAAGCVSKLVAFEPPFTAQGGGDTGNENLARQIGALVSEGKRGDAVELFQLSIGIPQEVVAQIRHAPFRPALDAIAHTLVYELLLLGSGAVPAEAQKISVPTLVLIGGDSPEPLQTAGRAVAKAVPDALLEVIEGVDHAASPEQMAPAIRAFLAG